MRVGRNTGCSWLRRGKHAAYAVAATTARIVFSDLQVFGVLHPVGGRWGWEMGTPAFVEEGLEQSCVTQRGICW